MPPWRILAFFATAIVVAYAVSKFGLARSVVTMVGSGAAVCGFMYLQKRAAKHRGGWRYLTPSPIEWICFIGVPLFVALLSCVYFFASWDRPDAEYQKLSLRIMIVGLSVIGALAIYLSLCIVTRWNDDLIQQRAVGLRARDIRISDIVTVQYSQLLQSLRIESVDGSVIRVSVIQNGTDELVAFLMEKLHGPPDDIPEIDEESEEQIG